jgi:hypothetical protein
MESRTRFAIYLLLWNIINSVLYSPNQQLTLQHNFRKRRLLQAPPPLKQTLSI